MALADFVGDDAALLIACKRILDRQPRSAPLVWLVAHALGAPNQRQALWQAVEALEDDRTTSAAAAELPSEATVATLTWNSAVSELARVRGDLSFIVVDVDGNAEYQIDRYVDPSQSVVCIDAEGTAQALFDATHLLVPLDALGPESGLAPLGSFAAAAVARHLELPVWGVAPTGVALPERMYSGLARRWHERETEPLWLRDVEEVPVSLMNHVVTTGGVRPVSDAIAASGCPIVPELF